MTIIWSSRAVVPAQSKIYLRVQRYRAMMNIRAMARTMSTSKDISHSDSIPLINHALNFDFKRLTSWNWWNYCDVNLSKSLFRTYRSSLSKIIVWTSYETKKRIRLGMNDLRDIGTCLARSESKIRHFQGLCTDLTTMLSIIIVKKPIENTSKS
jgi:hypothetical protein